MSEHEGHDHGAEGDSHDEAKTGWSKADTLKLMFILVAFVEAFLSGMIPVIWKKFTESPKFLGIANAFSAGVFMAISILHILPEVSGANQFDEIVGQL